MKYSIFIRILAACIVPLVCVFVILAITINQVVYNQVTIKANETSASFAAEITEQINNNHTNVKALLDWVIDRLLAADPSAPDVEEEISEFIESLLIATPYVHCIWFSFEPDGFIAGLRFSIDYVKHNNGIIRLSDFDDHLLLDPDLAPWYYHPFNTGEIWFETADYYDYEIGTGHAYTDTVSMPLIRDGDIVGVAGIDTLYTDQFRFLGDRDIPDERKLLLMTQAGEIVFSSDNQFITDFIFDLPHGNTNRIRDALNNNALSIFEGNSPFYGVRSVMSLTPVYAEFASQQLFLYTDMPTSILLKPAHDAMRIITILSVIGLLALGTILLLILRNTLKPIKALTKNANKIAAGKLDADLVLDLDSTFESSDGSVVTNNEIVLLSAALKKMLHRLRQVQELEIREQALAIENAALDRVSRLKNELVAVVSHELRTPLTVMSNYSQLAVKAISSGNYEHESIKRLSIIPKETKRLADLSETLLMTFKEQDGARVKAPLSINKLITRTANVWAPIMDKKGNKQRLSVGANLPLISGNADELMQVMFNLLSNADTHTRGGDIEISASVEVPEGDGMIENVEVRLVENEERRKLNSRFIVVTISDTGDGIAPELLPFVFEKHRHDEMGTGYGLPICKEIVEEHGGSICIESEPLNRTKVTFTIPILERRGVN